MANLTGTRLAQYIQRALDEESTKLYRGYTPTNSRAYGCSIDGCPNPAYAKKLCNAHYIRDRKGMDMSAPLRNRLSGANCTICGKALNGKGGWNLCGQHYKMRRRRIVRRVCIEAMGDVCLRCGQQYPDYVYDFHHLEADDKLHSLGNAIDTISMTEYAEEVVKCALLCANCHRITHAVERAEHEHARTSEYSP